MPTPGWLRRPDLPLDAKGRSYIDAPSLDQILDQMVNWRGDVNASGYKLVGLSMALPSNIQIGEGVAGNHSAWIDLVGDDTYTDYGLRIIRNAAGPNATSDLIHRGSGGFRLMTTEGAPVSIYVGAAESFRFVAAGLYFPDGTLQGSAGVPATRQIIAGTGLTGGGDLTADRTLSVANDTSIQKVIAGANGAQTGQRAWINFVAGSNVVLSAADEPAQNRVNITINSTGGGAGGSQTPWLSDINAAGFALSGVGALGIGITTSAAKLHVVCSGFSDSPAIQASTQSAIRLLSAAGTGGFGIGRSIEGSNEQSFFLFDAVAGAHRLTMNSNGNIGIGLVVPTTPSNILTVQETQPDVQTGAGVAPSAWFRGLRVKGQAAADDGGCIQFGTTYSDGIGWAIKMRAKSGNEGLLSFYGLSNSTGQLHEIMRLEGGGGYGNVSVPGGLITVLQPVSGGTIHVGQDLVATANYGSLIWIGTQGLGLACGGSIPLIIRTNGGIQLQIGTTPTAAGSGLLYKDASGFVKMG